jgi:hypothetical protein
MKIKSGNQILQLGYQKCCSTARSGIWEEEDGMEITLLKKKINIEFRGK